MKFTFLAKCKTRTKQQIYQIYIDTKAPVKININRTPPSEQNGIATKPRDTQKMENET